MRSSARLARHLRPQSSRLRPSPTHPFTTPRRSRPFPPHRIPAPILPFTRPFTTTPSQAKGIQPDTDDPRAPSTEKPHHAGAAQPHDLSETEYNELADQYIDALVLALEERAEEVSNGIEVEYSAGVLTLNHPSGTYIINKQPPNKQIWLSSPVSGPKRYDWVITGDGQHQKEGTETHDDGAGGKWTYLRDGSTLSELLRREVEVDFTLGGGEEVRPGREGPGGGGGGLTGVETEG